MSFKWQCPFCYHHAVIGEQSYHEDSTKLLIDNREGLKRIDLRFVVCPNPDCNRFTLHVTMKGLMRVHGMGVVECTGGPEKQWNLIPESPARQWPDYVPEFIREDYKEACLIVQSSPKAAATLARRCLQGMIRDFWQIRKDRLKDEVDALKGKVQPDIWDAIDGIRQVGNIGAHMEKDVDLVVGIDPGEAETLIGLIEMLIEDWYIERHEREKRVAEAKALADRKQAQRKKPIP